MNDFNWNDLKYFIAVARTRNVAAAARNLNVDHNTVRRRISALETDLTVSLFDRRSENHLLTDAGERLLALAESIEHNVCKAEEDVAGGDASVAGVVRIGAPDGIGTMFLAPRLAKLCDRYPQLNVELLTTYQPFDLSRREADMAIHIGRPTRGRVTVTKLVDTTMRLYASKEYCAKMKPLRNIDDLVCHNLISGIYGLDFGPTLNAMMDDSAVMTARVVCTSSIAQLQATASGAGICLFSKFLAETAPELTPILADKVAVEREIWLSYHSDLKDLARIKAVREFLISEFTQSKEKFN
ncbi:MAG: LysR family transcriptional regulator [Pseudomonadota bacterium]|nr:LysR family transcriptional regulator [Pseudomonadota bacterium]